VKPSSPAFQYRRPFQELIFSNWILVPFAMVLGAFVAMQFFQLTPRYVKLLVGVAFLLAVVRLPMPRAVTLFCLIFPAPTFIFLADTNVLFIGLLCLMWLIRRTRRQASPAVSTTIDWALCIYLGVHILSFINVSSPDALGRGGAVMQFIVAGVVLFWLIVNAIRTERDLQLLLQALCWTSAFVYLTAIVEWLGQGAQLVPEWFLFRGGHTTIKDARIGGIFGFHGLLADWSAMMFFLHVTMAARAQRRIARIAYITLAAASLLMIGISVNRGGAIILILGGAMYLWYIRRHLNWPVIVLWTVGVVGIGGLLGIASSAFTDRFLLLGRIAGTQFQRGIPDTRIEAWMLVTRKIPEHWFIGHGPYYDLAGGRNFGVLWPHSAYLFYLYSTGIVGLATFLWIVLKLYATTRPGSHVNFRRVPISHAALAIGHIWIVMFAIAQIRDEHQRGNVYVYVMWITFGVAIAARQIRRDSVRRARAAAAVAASAGP